MKYIVNTPSKVFNGFRAGIEFKRGTSGEVELTKELYDIFLDSGYEIIPVGKEVKEATKRKATTKKPTEAKRGE